MDARVVYPMIVASGSIFAFSASLMQCAALLAFPVICSVETRKHIPVIVTVFYASMCLPIIWVIHSYSGSLFAGLAQFAGLVLLNSVVVGISLWQRVLPRYVSLPIALIMLSLPPFSYINPVSLLPLSGWIFPSMGDAGIVFMLILVGLSTTAKRWGVPAYAAIMALAIPIGNSYAIPDVNSVSGVSISRPHDPQLSMKLMRRAYRFEELDLVASADTETVILPESVFGVWEQSDGDILSQSGRTIYGGSSRYVSQNQYQNVIVNAKTGNVVYIQRNVPYLLHKRTARAVSGLSTLSRSGISFLICYELLNPILARQAFSSMGKDVAWVSNLSWFNHNYLGVRMESVAVAWSRLYSSSYESAVLKHD